MATLYGMSSKLHRAFQLPLTLISIASATAQPGARCTPFPSSWPMSRWTWCSPRWRATFCSWSSHPPIPPGKGARPRTYFPPLFKNKSQRCLNGFQVADCWAIGANWGCNPTPEHLTHADTHDSCARRTSPPTASQGEQEKILRNLQTQARSCQQLVLWLDCDREGENIAFEVGPQARPSCRSSHMPKIAAFPLLSLAVLS